jgi:hypothetical protein
MTWNTTVRPWIEAAKMLTPQRSFLGGRERSLTAGAALVGVAALGIASAGTAYAAWKTTGSGSGHSRIASGYSSTITGNVTTSSATTTTLLAPSGTGDVAVKITNSNTFPIKVTGVQLTAGSATGCTTPALSAATPTSYTVNGSPVTLPLTITAGSTTTLVEVGAVTMGASGNSCQGKTLDIPLSINWTG